MIDKVFSNPSLEIELKLKTDLEAAKSPILIMNKETATKTTVIAIAIVYRSQIRITNLKRIYGYSETTRLSLSIRIRSLKCIHWCNWLRENGWRPMGSSKYGSSAILRTFLSNFRPESTRIGQTAKRFFLT